MMFNNIKKAIILCIGITLILPWKVSLAIENKSELLIIYDQYKEYASKNNNLNYVIKMALTTGKNIELRKINSYTTEDLNNAEGIIILSNEEGSFKGPEVEELYIRSEKLLWIGKNSSDEEVVPLNFKDKRSILEIKKKINDKFNNKENKKRNCYLLIDEVYPYDDLNWLVKKADYLYDQGIPFLVSAMGVYENLEFDAMKRYVEALRYCVASGGTVILGDPYLYDKGPTEEELMQNVSIAQDAFVNYKVYPIATTINDYYLYRNDRKKYLDETSTIIINENQNLGVIDFEKYSIGYFDNVLLKIDGEELNFSKELLTDVAIGIKGNEPIKDLQEKIRLYKKKGIEFSNTINLESKLTFGNNKITNNRNGLMVNDVNLRGNKFLSKQGLYGDEDKNLEDEIPEKSGIIDLTNVNKGIFVIAIMGVIVFIIFFLYSLKIDKKKYFK
ncbi:hypothetical protein [Clostridium gasigenes]|uniref:DUF2334 domain-containing protein n=2 Tax=Clostridium gasigenes TaxID=94869 RepID=A0A1H0VB42_9CLOT|nr:hypothetical protein [Clostridium gasigenes]SDP75316.1 hypothetical protein SAMN04488529_11524 [Clostridium gasigenes]